MQQYLTFGFGYSSVPSIRSSLTVVGDTAAGLSPATAIPSGSTNLPVAFSIVLAKLQSLFLLCDQAVTLKAGGVNAVQQIAITGTPTGGTFTLSFGGQATAAIAYSATAAQVQSALVALTSIGAGGVTCTGGPLPGSPVSITFAGLNAVQPVALITANTSGLTGGTSPAATLTTTTTGVNPDTTLSLLANDPLIWRPNGYFPNPFAANVATLYVTNASGVAANLNLQTLSNA